MTDSINVLVACEMSGIGRDAFRAAGFNAISCDLEATLKPGPHHQGDVRDILSDPHSFFGGPIHLMIAHPPCTYMTNAGARWLWKYDREAKRTITDENGQRLPDWKRWRDMEEGADFFRLLRDADVPRIAVENPVMVGYAQALIGGGPDTLSRSDWQALKSKPTQTIQPWQYGHMELKRTCLWLKGLPPLVETRNVYAEMMASTTYAQRAKVHHAAPGKDRQMLRSLWFQGFADAMVAQWGPLLREELEEAA